MTSSFSGEVAEPSALPLQRHSHEWGEIETSRFSGNVHRKCVVVGCNHITLDVNTQDDYTLGSCGCVDYHYADCPTRQRDIDDWLVQLDPYQDDPYDDLEW